MHDSPEKHRPKNIHVTQLESGIIEVRPDERSTISGEDARWVEEYLHMLSAPHAPVVLIDRRPDHELTFEAQLVILRDTAIEAVALLTKSHPGSYHIASFVIETLLVGRHARLFRRAVPPRRELTALSASATCTGPVHDRVYLGSSARSP